MLTLFGSVIKISMYRGIKVSRDMYKLPQLFQYTLCGYSVDGPRK